MSSLVTIPLIGYAPDLDPTTPGAFSYCLGMESSTRGWKLQRARDLIGTVTSAGSTSFMLDGLISDITDGTEITTVAMYESVAGKIKLYVKSGTGTGTLADKSQAGNYTLSGTENFVFCQFGNYTLGTNNVEKVQIRDASGSSAFADSAATGIPKAKICVTFGPPSQQRVMLLDYNDGTRYPSGWWVSALGGPTQAWTPDIATGAANNQLYGAGPIRCGIAYRDMIVAWGDRQMWVGRVTDPPLLIDWQKISDEIGCCGPYAARVLNGALYWVGKQGLFVFDGNGISKVRVDFQQELISTIAGLGTSERLIQMTVDGGGQRLLIAIRTAGYTSSQVINKWYSINVLNNRVGVLDNRYLNSVSMQLALDRRYMGTAYSPNSEAYTFRENTSPWAAALTDLFGFGLPYIGADKGDTRLRGVIPRFVSAPSTYKCTDYYGPTMAEALSNTNTAVTVSATPWRADFQQSARWHAPRLHFSSNGTVDVEVIDVVVDAVAAGNA